MRVVIAPDKFAGTLTAAEAAEAIARGWSAARPDDDLDLAPVSDGGPGFLAVLHAALGGELLPVPVHGPFGEPLVAELLRVGTTVYVESALACGVALTSGRGGERATSRGVGELLGAARETGAERVVVGLGGSGTNDGGAGMLAALGATADRPFDAGGASLSGIRRLHLPRWAGQLVAASDVANPLTGPRGATHVFGPQKGVTDLDAVDAALADLARAAGAPGETGETQGDGAAGGLGFALRLLGATRRPGLDIVADAIGLRPRVERADLVVTGEGSYDDTGAAGKVPDALRAWGTPTIVLAGRVEHASSTSYSLVDLVGESAAMARPADGLVMLAQHVAGTIGSCQ